ncbi:MAG: dCTP deaminase, partial [Acidimicrobiales bacterium]|nr:dCTP deaminase [Acidimicrobiales bacterium]
MILSDRSILKAVQEGRIIIEPFDQECLQPSSVDLHLDHRFLVFKNHTLGHIDVREDLSNLTQEVSANDGDP